MTDAQSTRLFDALRRVGAEVDARGLPWALVGGLAVSARSEPRFTRDLDLVVDIPDDAQAETLVSDLRAVGYVLELTLEQQALGRLATVRFRPPSAGDAGVVVDFLFASCGIEADVCAASQRLAIVRDLDVPIARSGHLVAMKLLSRSDHRLQDDIDLRTLARVLTADDVVLAREAVRRIEAVGANRGRALVTDLEAYLSQFYQPS